MKKYEINCETKYRIHRHYFVYADNEAEAWDIFLELQGGSKNGYKNIEVKERKAQ